MPELITPKWCRERDACYTDDELVAVLGAGKTVLEVLDLDIPVEHRVWAVSQWLPEREQRMFHADLLSRAFARERAAGREPDKRSVAMLSALEAGRWPTREESAAAWGAQAEAARAASRVARAAHGAGIWLTRAAAERSAVAAWEVAWGEACEAKLGLALALAAARAAEAAEHNSQLACLRRLVEEVQNKETACQV